MKIEETGNLARVSCWPRGFKPVRIRGRTLCSNGIGIARFAGRPRLTTGEVAPGVPGEARMDLATGFLTRPSNFN